MKLCKIFAWWFLVMFVGFLIPPYIFPHIPIVFLQQWGIEWQESEFMRAFSAGMMSASGITLWYFKNKCQVMRLFKIFAFYFLCMFCFWLITPYILCYVPIASIASYMESQIASPKELLFSSLVVASFWAIGMCIFTHFYYRNKQCCDWSKVIQQHYKIFKLSKEAKSLLSSQQIKRSQNATHRILQKRKI